MPILTLQQLQTRLKEFTYKDWELNIYEGAFEGLQFEIKANMTDNFNPGQPFAFHCVSPLPPFLSLEQFDHWLLWRIKRIEIHECMENLKVNGKAFIDPHREDANQDKLTLNYNVESADSLAVKQYWQLDNLVYAGY